MHALEMALEALTNPSTIAVQHAVELIRAELAKPEQEPWLWINKKGSGVWISNQLPVDPENWDAVYKSPPRKEWVGLTDDECIKLIDEIRIYSGDYELLIARTIEAKLKEKNNAV